MQCRKGFKNLDMAMDCSFSKDIVLSLQRCVQTNFHYALTRVIQFVCTHRRSYKTTSFEKEQSIA